MTLSPENRLLIGRVPGGLAASAYVAEDVLNTILDAAREEGREQIRQGGYRERTRRGDPVEPPFGCAAR